MKNFLKTYKEELVAIPVLVLGFFLLNWILSSLFPNSAFFDFSSQMETIYYRLLSVVVCFAFAWLALRISFPQVYNYLREEFYHNFEDLDPATKRKYAIRIFLVFVICVALVSRSVGGETSEIRGKLIHSLESQLNVRETSPNRGYMVDKYLHSVGVNVPAPWCAAFVSYNLQQYKIPNPCSAWSPNYALSKDVIYKAKKKIADPLPGDVVTYYYPRLKRVGHVGFYCQKDQSGYIITIEGNTNGGGSREGDGVYKKKRELSKIYAISRYIK
ncbi:MAG: CHAP domain-containing protein [Bacteroidetes bacterium]|nr:CHAP domain-containing protein [Bacteroidota bacterium]